MASDFGDVNAEFVVSYFKASKMGWSEEHYYTQWRRITKSSN